jgi:tetratricopeptide (TPR) repeat protein
MRPHVFVTLALGLGLVLSVACTERPSVENIVRGFFDEVNKSNFESGKTRYLSTALKSAIDSPSMVQHEPVSKSFGQFAGYIQAVDIQSDRVEGETATVSVVIATTWGARAQGTISLIREEGRAWRISDWSQFETLGSEHLAKAASFCEGPNLNAALAEYHKALEENPHDSTIYTAVGECYLRTGNVSAAEEQFKIAISMYPDAVWEPYIALADSYQKRGDIAKAEQAYKKAIKNRPDYWVPYNNLAYLYAEKGTHLDEAIALAQKALSLSPDEAASLDTLGWAYYKKGDRTQALKYLARALAKLPANKEALTHYRAASKP